MECVERARRGLGDLFPLFVVVLILIHPGLMIVGVDHDRLGFKDIFDAIAHQLENTLQVQLGHQAFLHAGDHGEFGVALLGFHEQACVLERHAHAGGQRGQQAQVGFLEGVFPLDVLQADRAGYDPAQHQGHKDG